jgi:hypothetical protein
MKTSNDMYCIDQKGDRDVLTYGMLYKYDIPKYYEVGEHFCVGSPITPNLNCRDVNGITISKENKPIVSTNRIW